MGHIKYHWSVFCYVAHICCPGLETVVTQRFLTFLKWRNSLNNVHRWEAVLLSTVLNVTRQYCPTSLLTFTYRQGTINPVCNTMYILQKRTGGNFFFMRQVHGPPETHPPTSRKSMSHKLKTPLQRKTLKEHRSNSDIHDSLFLHVFRGSLLVTLKNV